MEYDVGVKVELATRMKLLFLILLLSLALIATLELSSLLYSSNGCTRSVAAAGRTDGAPIHWNRKLAFAYVHAGIYGFTMDEGRISSAVGTGSRASTKYLYYNSRFHDIESIMPANPNLQKLWTSKAWRMKVTVFVDIFSDMIEKDLLKPCVKALCIGAGQGHEVMALKELGILNSIGIDLVAFPPLVLKGDMHNQPFEMDTFDFEFSNVFDHALFTSEFASEIGRTLKPGGYVVIHLMLRKRIPNNLQCVDALITLFSDFDVIHVGDIDAFGLDTEVIFQKPHGANVST